MRSNVCKRTPLDILHSYMTNETTFGHNYPDSDKPVTLSPLSFWRYRGATGT